MLDDLRSNSRAVYLDGHATTPLAPEAAAAMSPWWSERAANAHSPHGGGQRAANAVETARGQVAHLIGAAPDEIIFTSGATEANALALLGVVAAARGRGDPRRRVLVSTIEHKSVLGCADRLGQEGFEIVRIPVDHNARVDLDALRRELDDSVLLVSIMGANNEVGVLQPLASIAALVRETDALLHTDAAQLVGKCPIDAPDFDFVSVSSHKMYGPVGVGALFVSGTTPLRPRPLFAGGDQEKGLRPGTLPVPLIVGFGEAARLARLRLATDAEHTTQLSGRLVAALKSAQVRFRVNAPDAEKLPGSLSIQFDACDASSLITRLSDAVYIAEGSACTSGRISPSHVLTSMGLSEDQAGKTVRICIGRYTTTDEVDRAAVAISHAVHREKVAHWTAAPVGLPHERLAARS